MASEPTDLIREADRHQAARPTPLGKEVFCKWCGDEWPCLTSRLRDALEAERRQSERLAAALYAVIWDAHPVFSSTALWHGGIGGQAITPHCSLVHGAPPGQEFWELLLHEEPLRGYLHEHPEFDVKAAKDALIEEWKNYDR